MWAVLGDSLSAIFFDSEDSDSCLSPHHYHHHRKKIALSTYFPPLVGRIADYSTMKTRAPKTSSSKRFLGNPITWLHRNGNTKFVLFLNMIFCVCGIYGCFGIWAHKQERIVTIPYTYVSSTSGTWGGTRTVEIDEYFPGIWSLGFLQSALGFGLAVCGLTLLRVYHKIFHGQKKKQQKISSVLLSSPSTSDPRKEPSTAGSIRKAAGCFFSGFSSSESSSLTSSSIWKPFSVLCFSNAFGSSIGYSAMRLVPYPVFLTAKMAKTFPLMFVGYFFLGNRFPRQRIILCTLLTASIYAFYVLSPRSPQEKMKNRKSDISPTGSTNTWVSSHPGEVGMLLLWCNLIMDGVTNATQDAFIRSQKKRWNGLQLMCVVNMGTCFWLFLAMLLAELPIFSSTMDNDFSSSSSASSSFSLSNLWPAHDATRSIYFFQRHPEAARDVAILSIVNGIGQFFIFFTITLFGTLTLTVVTLVRKAGSVGVSIVLHGHPVCRAQGAALVAALLCAFCDSALSIGMASSSWKKRYHHRPYDSVPESGERSKTDFTGMGRATRVSGKGKAIHGTTSISAATSSNSGRRSSKKNNGNHNKSDRRVEEQREKVRARGTKTTTEKPGEPPEQSDERREKKEFQLEKNKHGGLDASSPPPLLRPFPAQGKDSVPVASLNLSKKIPNVIASPTTPQHSDTPESSPPPLKHVGGNMVASPLGKKCDPGLVPLKAKVTQTTTFAPPPEPPAPLQHIERISASPEARGKQRSVASRRRR